MTPARQPPRRGSARDGRPPSGRRVYAERKRRKRRWVRPLLVGVVAVALVVGVGALYYGFAPGAYRSEVARDTAIDGLATTPATLGRPGSDSSARVDSAALLGALGDSVMIAASDSTRGEDVYRRVGRCLGCHGAAGEGVPSLAPSLREPTAGRGSIAAVRRIVAHGLPATPAYRIAMPAYDEQLGEEEIRLVAAFVYTLSHPGRVVAAPVR